MPTAEDRNILIETTLDRALRIRDYVENMIATLREHPECELKLTWRRDSAYHKAEFVKDIQATANSSILEGKDRYIVVGVNQDTKAIEGCSHSDFDDASIRQLLENYLDPIPDFEVLCLQASSSKDFVVVRFPHQVKKPFIVKSQIKDDKKVYLEEGEIWLKPGSAETGSSGKRRLKSRAEIIGLIDIEPYVKRAVSERVEQVIPTIRLEERTRLQGQAIDSISALASSDEEFQSHIEQLLLNPSGNHLNVIHVLVEKLREKTVEVWDIEDGYISPIRPLDIQRIKETEFLPAMRRLIFLGLLLIKFSASQECFAKITDLLLHIFKISNRLAKVTVDITQNSEVSSLKEHNSFSVPALESLIAAYFLGGYELSNRNENIYVRHLFTKIVTEIRGADDTPSKDFFMFWPVTRNWGYPNRRRDLLVSERFSIADRLEKLAGGKKGIKAASLQIECLIDWHSFLSFQGQGEPETIQFYQKFYSGISTSFWPNFRTESYEQILPLINKLWEAIHTEGQNDFWLFDSRLSKAFGGIDLARRKRLFGKFLLYVEGMQAEYQAQHNRGPYHMPWATDIAQVISEVRKTTAPPKHL